jgi:hypothetical protein
MITVVHTSVLRRPFLSADCHIGDADVTGFFFEKSHHTGPAIRGPKPTPAIRVTSTTIRALGLQEVRRRRQTKNRRCALSRTRAVSCTYAHIMRHAHRAHSATPNLGRLRPRGTLSRRGSNNSISLNKENQPLSIPGSSHRAPHGKKRRLTRLKRLLQTAL